jgi:hypothetical protein
MGTIVLPTTNVAALVGAAAGPLGLGDGLGLADGEAAGDGEAEAEALDPGDGGSTTPAARC